MKNIIEQLERSEEPLFSSVIYDKHIQAAEKAFDCIFDGVSNFYPWEKPKNISEEFSIGVIYGASGSGKSTLLGQFGCPSVQAWDNTKAIVSHFESPDEGINKLSAVGLNSIPSWYKSYDVLSTGEKFRADLSRSIKDNAVIDEFTSVVDRNVAKAASVAISKYIKKNNIKNVVISTCHEDVLDWLEPDWVINTNNGEVYDGNFIKGQTSISKYIEQTIVSGPCLKTITI
jgi:ABC-type ATPase with predicted acetyltransferase domain